MSEPIKAGDLVMVIRWPHACRNKIGKVFQVARVNPFGVRCPSCNEDLFPEHGPSAEIANKSGCPLSWLKRIPPLSELEGEKRDEEITA